MSLTPTMSKLIELLNQQRARRIELEEEFKSRHDDEAVLSHSLKLAHARAMLCSVQPTEGLRQAEAEVATEELGLKYRLAVSLRRSAKEALNGCHDDAETLQAAFHAYNRELKVLEG